MYRWLPLFFCAPAMAAETAARTGGYAGAVASMVLSLLAVIAMIFGLAWLVRRTGLQGKMLRTMKVSSAVTLGAREKVVVVTVDQRRFLLGVTGQQISLIAELDAEQPAVEDEPVAGDFAKKLQEMLAKGMSK